MVHDHDLCACAVTKYAYFSRRICMRACVRLLRVSLRRIHCAWGGSRPPAPLGQLSGQAPGDRREQEYQRTTVVASAYMRDELLRNGFAAGQMKSTAPVPRGAVSAERLRLAPATSLFTRDKSSAARASMSCWNPSPV